MRPTTRTRLGNKAIGVAILLSVAPTIAADELQPYEKRELHDFEQCASLCQRQLDADLFKCAPYRPEGDKAAPEDCGKVCYETYDSCMNACPADPRQRT
ncbi:MAG TPA: hypothetical protein VLB07_12505 [Woeseiaceae bacterium]|nr:hypothetical protein [Woeseiaceae bacterium]